MAEKHFVFLKDNRVEHILVFAEKDELLASKVAEEKNCDLFLWIDEEIPPALFSLYDAKTKTYTAPDLDYLYERGVHNENIAMRDARIAAEEAAKETPTV